MEECVLDGGAAKEAQPAWHFLQVSMENGTAVWAGDPPVGLSVVRGPVQSVSHPALPWGCWPQKQPALGRVIQLALQQSQLLEQRFPQRTALAGEIYLIFFPLWINTEPGFHLKGLLPIEFVLSCAFLQE